MQKKLFQIVLGLVFVLGLSMAAASATDVTTFAGDGSAGSTDATGQAASFYTPMGADVDSSGNLFIADYATHLIRKITPAGVVTTFAGNGQGSTDANGTAASFYNPTDLVIDSNDNIYVADYSNHLIRKITPDGKVRTFAGKPGTYTPFANGLRGAATFYNPVGLGIDNGNNIYVADSNNHRIRKITPDGVVTTLAGNGDAETVDDTGTAAGFNSPYDIVMASTGDLYVAEYGSHTIRKITSGAVVTTFAGTVGVSGSTDDTGTSASFNSPIAITADSSDDLYVSDYSNHTIRKITLAGVVTTPTGTATTSGSDNGSLAAATYNNPRGLSIMTNGAILLADAGNNMVRKIINLAAGKGSPSGTPDTLPDGTVTTLAGNGDAGNADGTGGDANFQTPGGSDVDSNGNLFVADAAYHLIRKITPAGVVTTFAGNSQGSTDANGTAASFYTPTDIVIDSNNNIFVADSANHTIRKITPDGRVRTFAGKPGTYTPFANGPRGAATFYNPVGLGIDNGNNIYVADSNNHKIRKITPDGVVTTLAGNGDAETVDDTGTAAAFNSPYDIAMASNGSLYVAEYGSHTIRKISSGGVVTTWVGDVGVAGDLDGTGSAAKFNAPLGLAIESSGSIYVADYSNHLIRKVTAAGVVTTVTGSAGDTGFDNGPVYEALYSSPRSITIAANASMLVMDVGNSALRKIVDLASGRSTPSGTPDTLPDGTVTTLAGNGDAGNADGTGGDANFQTPGGSDVDSNGNLFVADAAYHLIRKVTPAGVVTTFAGSVQGSTDANGTAASFYTPTDVVIDSNNNIFVADSANHTIRKITPDGRVRTFAGKPGTYTPFANGVRGAATFYNPVGLGIDNGNNIYVADSNNHRIRKITPDGVVTTLAGNGDAETVDDTGTAAGFNSPYDVAMASNGSLYVAEYGSHTIRKISSGGVVTTWVGDVGVAGDLDGTGSAAKFNAPLGLAIESSGSIYVADYSNHLIRKVTAAGVVTKVTGSSGDTGFDDGAVYEALYSSPRSITIAANASMLVMDVGNSALRKIVDIASGRSTPSGTPDTLPSGTVTTLAGNGDAGNADGTGGDANFQTPVGAAIDSSGNVFVTDTAYHLIRKITPAGVVTTFAGTGSAGAVDDTGTAASFSNPLDIAIDSSNNLYVADTGNHNIRKITPAGVVTTFAGTGSTGAVDDTGTAASFSSPSGIGIDSSNNLYVADTANHTIRKITSLAVVTTLAGSAGNADSTNGTGASARFSSPTDIVMAGTGDLYVTDTGNHTIRKVTTGGVVTKLAGTTGVAGDIDGTGVAAQFSSPSYITVDPDDRLFVADSGNHIIRKVTLAGVVTTPTGSSADTGMDDGPIYSSLYSSPKGLAINSSNCNMLVTDSGNNTIRKIAGLASGCTGAVIRRRMVISHLFGKRNKLSHLVQE